MSQSHFLLPDNDLDIRSEPLTVFECCTFSFITDIVVQIYRGKFKFKNIDKNHSARTNHEEFNEICRSGSNFYFSDLKVIFYKFIA